MTRNEYLENLRRLPIENPTAEDMASVCPHLTKEQALAAFRCDSGHVACPPLRIRGGHNVIAFYKDWKKPTLTHAFSGRTLKSYANGKKHGDIFTPSIYMEEAMLYAEDNWGDELIQDNWVDVIRFHIQDPTNLSKNGSPMTTHTLMVTINRDWNELINDHSKPESQLLDDAIMEMSLDPLIMNELKGGRGGFTQYNCAFCGHGLGLSGCNCCHHNFRDDQFRCGWDTPLSSKMVKFLQANGHVFKMNPKIAWGREEDTYYLNKADRAANG